MNTKTIPGNAYPALFSGLMLLGVSPILIKLAGAPGIITTFYRMLVGTIALTPIFLWALMRGNLLLPRRGIMFALLAGVFLATDMAFWTSGIMASNATLPTLTGNLAPIWVGIGAILFFKEKQNVWFWAGLILAVIGVMCLIGKEILSPGATLKGIVYGLFAGIFYSGYQLCTQPGRKYLNTLAFLYLSTVATTVTSFVYALFFQLEFTGYAAQTWWYWLAMGLGIQVTGWFMINYSQGHLPASVVSPTLLGQPVMTAIIATFLLGESFTLWQIVGGIIIVAGIYLVHFTRGR